MSDYIGYSTCYYPQQNKARDYYGSDEHWHFKYNLLQSRYDKLSSQYDDCQYELDEYESYVEQKKQQWKQGFSTQAVSGLNIALHPAKMYDTEVIDKYSVSANSVGSIEDDLIMNIKSDDEKPGMFKMKLMSDKVSTVVTQDGDEIPAVVEMSVEVPVEVIKEVSVEVSVDMTDEVLKNILSTIQDINDKVSKSDIQAMQLDVLSAISDKIEQVISKDNINVVVKNPVAVYNA